MVWTRSGRAGIELDNTADVPELLRSISGKTAQTGTAYVPRPPRLSTDCPIKVLVEGRTAPSRMLDLSQRGARLHVRDREPDEQITLKIPGLEPRKAAVRWVRGEEAGVVFFETLAYQQLDRWLHERGIRYAARLG